MQTMLVANLILVRLLLGLGCDVHEARGAPERIGAPRICDHCRCAADAAGRAAGSRDGEGRKREAHGHCQVLGTVG
jgi:hypothetical protein